MTYTPDEVAKILKVHKRTVYNLIRSGKLRAAKVGALYRIDESELSRILSPQDKPAA